MKAKVSKPGPVPLPPYRPITGYRADLPMPKIEKTFRKQHRHIGKNKAGNHPYLIWFAKHDWAQMTRISVDLCMPIATIIRLSLRRFIRAYKFTEVLTDDGRVARRMTTRRLFTRAEREVLGHLPHGPRKSIVEREERALMERAAALQEEQELTQAEHDLVEEIREVHLPEKRPMPDNFKKNPRYADVPPPKKPLSAPRLFVPRRGE